MEYKVTEISILKPLNLEPIALGGWPLGLEPKGEYLEFFHRGT
jgi:hypothetical protein